MQQRSEETRTRLLEAALKRFALQGYAAASVDEICADAGVSKGAFYHHFSSKQEIFLALLQDWLAMIDQGLQSLRQPTIPQTFVHITEMLPTILASADERLPLFLEFWAQASRDEAVWKATIEPYRHYQQYFANLVEEGIAEGSLKPVDAQAASRLIVSLAVGLFLQGVLDPHGADWQVEARESMKILMQGLAR
jgi:AcrR family transcriptional regulator